MALALVVASAAVQAAPEGRPVASYKWRGPAPVSKAVERGALVLRFARPLASAEAEAFAREIGPSVDEIAVGYDSVLVRPRAGESIEAVDGPEGIGLTIRSAPNRGTSEGELVLLRARALLALGSELKARAVLLDFVEAQDGQSVAAQGLWHARQAERIDRSGSGLATFEKLIEQRGPEPTILALYAATLIDIGAFRQAADVLGWR